ncbi:MAG: phosphatidate cytidylyltransferase [Vicinamibacteria bacterium]
MGSFTPRIRTALVAVPLLILLIQKGPAWLFLSVVLAFALTGYWELARVAAKIGWKPLGVGYLLVALLVTAFYPGFPSFEEVGVALVVLVGIEAVFFRGPGRDTLGGLAMTVLGALYLGSLLGTIVALRVVEPEATGRFWIVFLLAVVMVGDAGAFFVGKLAGKHPLAPVLSPKKTVEGFLGGVAFSVATALGLRSFLFPRLDLSTALGLGLSMALLGVVGDLFESFLKRSAGLKDTSTLIPGHGGVLDRIDSLLFAAPFLYLYVKWAGP